ncbi:MAG: hypothetical protein HRF51_01590 [bacterium]|jgi:hypothetical protein
MKSEAVKRGILIVLIALAAYIWGKNLDIFDSEPEYFRLTEEKKKLSEAESVRVDSLPYRRPAVNPFYDAAQRAEPGKPAQATPKSQKPPEKRFSDIYSLEGVVSGTNRPQAILRIEAGGRILVSVDDTISGWKVLKISPTLVIAAKGKSKDTLKLGED